MPTDPTPIITPLRRLLTSSRVLLALLAMLINVGGAYACPDGLEAETCSPRVGIILESVNTLGLALIAAITAEDVAGKIGAGLQAKGGDRPLVVPTAPTLAVYQEGASSSGEGR